MEFVVFSYLIFIFFMMLGMYVMFKKNNKKLIVNHETLFTYVEEKQIRLYDNTFTSRLIKEIRMLEGLIRTKSDNVTLILQLQRNIENKLSDLMILNKVMFDTKVKRLSTKINKQVDDYTKSNSLLYEDHLSKEWSI